MGSYNRVLLAVDFHADNDQVIEKAKETAQMHGATLFLIHVAEPIAYAHSDGMTSWGEEMVSLETAIRSDARKKLDELGGQLGVSTDHCYFRTGKPSTEIHELVKEEDIDLIVMGTHGQAGLQLLLGSTANSVLHGATCDVLAVRLGDVD